MVLSASSGQDHDSVPPHPRTWLVAQACPHPHRDAPPRTSNLQLRELRDQALEVVVSRHYFSPHFAHSLRLLTSSKLHGRHSHDQHGSTVELSISTAARCVPMVLLTPFCSGYCMSQAPHAGHRSALAGVDPQLGSGLQSSSGRHGDCKLALSSMKVG